MKYKIIALILTLLIPVYVGCTDITGPTNYYECDCNGDCYIKNEKTNQKRQQNDDYYHISGS